MRRELALIALCALGLRVAIAARDLDVLDRLFVPDDAYYTLCVARSLASGAPPSVDGVTVTNGFQPLLAFALVPVFAALKSVDLPLRAALTLMALSDAISCFFLGRIAERIAGRAAGLIAAALWALSPLAIANALGGLETALALALELALVLAWWNAREHPTASRFAVAGGVAGLGLLARVDSVFLVLALGLLEVSSRRFREVTISAAVALIVLAPWWLYSVMRFGTVVPESGEGVREIVELHQALYLDLRKQLAWAAGSIVGAPFVDAGALREALFNEPVFGVLAWLLVVLLAALAVSRWLPVRGPSAVCGAFAIHAALVFGFYSLVLPALWFFRRYLAPCHALITLLFAIGLARGVACANGHRKLKGALTTILASLLALGGATSGRWLFVVPGGTVDEGLHGAKGYREVARQIVEQVPAGAVLGAFQSGALAYYSMGRHVVVNLDGVVDAGAREAASELRLADYARQRGVTHIADWRFNIDNFIRLSERSQVKPRELEFLGAARRQGDERFLLFRLKW